MSSLAPEKYKEQFDKFYATSVVKMRFNRIDTLPCLNDIDSPGSYCPVYMLHTGWAARILAQTKPAVHTDISSLVYFVGIASAICPIKFYDITPVDICLPGVETGVADLTNLHFPTESIKSLSCMHVMEHVGLGRYGDPLDVDGDLKAAKELTRVVAKGGQLLMVLPVGQPRVVFNAHRIYSYEQVMEMFSGFELKEFSLVDVPRFIKNADPARVKQLNEGAGCFWFQKK